MVVSATHHRGWVNPVWIDTVPKMIDMKALHATAGDIAPGSICHKKWPCHTGQLCSHGPDGFALKAKIAVALHHVFKAESALCNMKYPSQGLARSLTLSPLNNMCQSFTGCNFLNIGDYDIVMLQKRK